MDHFACMLNYLTQYATMWYPHDYPRRFRNQYRASILVDSVNNHSSAPVFAIEFKYRSELSTPSKPNFALIHLLKRSADKSDNCLAGLTIGR
jgi:hypothetical protein